MAAEGLQRAIVDAADGGGLHGQVRPTAGQAAVSKVVLWRHVLRLCTWPDARSPVPPSAAAIHPSSPPQSYWLACSLAAGGLLKFRTIGRRDVGHLSRLGEPGTQHMPTVRRAPPCLPPLALSRGACCL